MNFIILKLRQVTEYVSGVGLRIIYDRSSEPFTFAIYTSPERGIVFYLIPPIYIALCLCVFAIKTMFLLFEQRWELKNLRHGMVT